MDKVQRGLDNRGTRVMQEDWGDRLTVRKAAKCDGTTCRPSIHWTASVTCADDGVSYEFQDGMRNVLGRARIETKLDAYLRSCLAQPVSGPPS